MTKCLVLGANGLIGSAISNALIEEGHELKALSKFNGKSKIEADKSKFEKIEGDYSNSELLKNALQGVEIVFHCIHTTFPRESKSKSVFDAETNILPSINLMEEAVKAGVKKIVYISSLAVYGNPKDSLVDEETKLSPLNPYGVSKIAIEEYLEFFSRTAGLDFVILRPCATYGKKQISASGTGVVANFLQNALAEKEIEIFGDGSAVRDLLYVDDLAAATLKAAFTKTKSKTFVIGTGEGISLKELVVLIEKELGKEVKVKYDNGPNIIQKLVCNPKRAETELGWKASVNLEQGIRKCIKHLKEGQ